MLCCPGQQHDPGLLLATFVFCLLKCVSSRVGIMLQVTARTCCPYFGSPVRTAGSTIKLEASPFEERCFVNS
uniref:Putative secreted protein n=1 Tax=Anopheles darlingi TaxID=43151 RepID=A0A2M4D432_ANODA